MNTYRPARQVFLAGTNFFTKNHSKWYLGLGCRLGKGKSMGNFLIVDPGNVQWINRIDYQETSVDLLNMNR